MIAKKRWLNIDAMGADIEVFLEDYAGRPIPVIGKLGGTKISPQPVPRLGEGFAVQEDNVMAEFNIPPAEDVFHFVDSLNKMVGYLSDHFRYRHALSLKIEPSAIFTEEQLNHDQAKEIGCEPDYCVWTLRQNKITAEVMKALRTCGGHVHTSYLSTAAPDLLPTADDTNEFVKMQDLTLGVPSILIDNDSRRRQAYGKAGAFRYKLYGRILGHEYRTLSNFWLKSDALKAWVYHQNHLACRLVNLGEIDFDKDGLGEWVQATINNDDKESATAICSEFGISLP